MTILAARSAAYTRTGILRRFLDLIADSMPARVDSTFAEQRLGLKGGDIRAFLQSVRVLGLIDPYGGPTERARRVRAMSQRGPEMLAALDEAYPELVQRWTHLGGMGREDVEDFFKVEYGLSTSSAGPAAKLFLDLMREYGSAELPRGGVSPTSYSLPAPAYPEPPLRLPTPSPELAAPYPSDVRVAALEMIKASLRIDINAEWDEERIRLVFDRMERLVGQILEKGR